MPRRRIGVGVASDERLRRRARRTPPEGPDRTGRLCGGQDPGGCRPHRTGRPGSLEVSHRSGGGLHRRRCRQNFVEDPAPRGTCQGTAVAVVGPTANSSAMSRPRTRQTARRLRRYCQLLRPGDLGRAPHRVDRARLPNLGDLGRLLRRGIAHGSQPEANNRGAKPPRHRRHRRRKRRARKQATDDLQETHTWVPRQRLRDVRADFDQMELKLRRMEAHVTSEHYELHRELAELEKRDVESSRNRSG